MIMTKGILIQKICEAILRKRYKLKDFTYNVLDITRKLKWKEMPSSNMFLGCYNDGVFHRCLVEVHPVSGRSDLTVITKGSGYIPETFKWDGRIFLIILMTDEFYLFLDRSPTNFRLIRCKFKESGGKK